MAEETELNPPGTVLSHQERRTGGNAKMLKTAKGVFHLGVESFALQFLRELLF